VKLTQYSLVCQAPDNEAFTLRAYSGKDLSQVVAITQAKDMPEGSYGWMQLCGHVSVASTDEVQSAYVDFRPNEARLQISGKWPNEVDTNSQESPGIDSFAKQKQMRISQLPPLLIEVGSYCNLLREARDVFADGHFYACVAMCGISLERFQRDKAKSHGGTDKHKQWEIRKRLEDGKALLPETITLCKNMAKMRNMYAHGHGTNPKEDAAQSLEWMHSFMDKETSLMRDYVIINGVLNRKTIQ